MGISFVSVFGKYTTETAEGLKNTFKNTELEPYLPDVIEFFFGETHRGCEYDLLNKTKNNLRCHMDETLQLAYLLQSLLGGVFKGRGWKIDSDEDRMRIYDSVVNIFLEKLDMFPKVAKKYWWAKYEPVIPEAWLTLLEDYPTRSIFDISDVDKGRIAGAALDVFSTEPLPECHPLLHTSHPERLRFTPHIAWASHESLDRLVRMMADNIRETMCV